MVTRSPIQEAKQTVEHLEVLRKIAEESAFQSRVATWAAVIGAVVAFVAAVFGFLSYMHMRNAGAAVPKGDAPAAAATSDAASIAE